MIKYDFKKIEKKWQDNWDKNKSYRAFDNRGPKKHYNLVEFPYPSGAGLHVGHVMGYGASDAYCRMKRLQGYNVMYPIGWDAFGLPTENYAIKNKIHPRIATDNNIKHFKKQMKSLGLSFDWSREIDTTDPDYYKWTQWIFLQFYKHAIVDGKLIKVKDDDKITPRLAYQTEMPINWCPSCKIGLANEEVIGGNCERCGAQTEKRMQKQWMLRITAYADRLIDDLETVDYLPKIKTQQVNWIGRSSGTNIKFKVVGRSGTIKDEKIEVFTTRADTLFGCTYMVVAPEHPIINKIKNQISNIKDVEEYINEARKKSDLERTELLKEKTGEKLKGISAINPINGKKIDIYVADYVLASYGTGAVMAVPAHDERDWEFAKKYNIPIVEVINPISQDKQTLNINKAFIDYGVLYNSNEFDGLESKDAITKITEKLIKLGAGDFAKNYKLRDWIFSRQHYWGEPIPIIHCKKCGTIPMKEQDLPLVLPEVEKYQPTDTGKSPLSAISDWVNVKCPKCGGSAKRETDTMPNWAGSSWYYLRYCDPKNNKELAKMDKLEYWLSCKRDNNTVSSVSKSGGGVDLYNGGMEHTTLHLLYSRFWHKFLFDLGVVPCPEPYKKRIAHGIILGPDNQKMSKSKGNVINPDDIIREYGADALRAYLMFIGPYDKESAWSMNGLMGIKRFLNKVYINFSKVSNKDNNTKLDVLRHKLINSVSLDIESYSLNTYIARLMEFNNELTKQKRIPLDIAIDFAFLLFPACPHLASELLRNLGVEKYYWPTCDKNKIVDNQIEFVIQINGKVRDKLSISPKLLKKDVIALSKRRPKIKEWMKKGEIIKTIYVERKLVNFVIK